MSLTDDQIKHIAKLSRLQIAQAELPMYREQLSSILEYMQKLDELDTAQVEELAFAVGGGNIFRQDKPDTADEPMRRGIVDAFPQKKGDLLEVQAVFESRTE